MVAALFVEEHGVYATLPGVEVWGVTRDARTYAGPHSVVAHPPCQRWGRYWHGGPSARVRQKAGDDDGCFAAALAAVRRWGGVLEHPEASKAWLAFGLLAPPHTGGWVSADFEGGWTCCVEQGHYGHRARKKTWLYAHGVVELPSLKWGPSASTVRLDHGFHNAYERREAQRKPGCAKCIIMGKRERMGTPTAFRDLLLSIARSAGEGR